MITEKPSWIRHEGMQIFSIDIQIGGLRFATGGGDHKVRIWNMKSVAKDSDNEPSNQRLLATLRDHFGSVNCVRWAKHGRFIASGSDDQAILIHERKPGSGTTEFGSGEPPDVENWKVTMTLRGHTADVVDLNWSPDDLTLASGSLDNTIHIWNVTSGLCTAVLRGHSSLVKGVAWDPVGTFIASQSDDKTVIIWRTSDWSLVHKTDGHWSKSVYTKCGRRAMPAMVMGSAAVFIDCDESWKILLVTRRGSLYVWNLFNRTCLLNDTLASLITLREDSSVKDTGTIRVISAKFSRSGSPLIVLATRHAFLFDMSLKCWLRIVDDCFPASNFATSFNLTANQSGELGKLQVDVGKFVARRPSWSRVTDDGVQTRAHLETQLASSLALKSPNEYRQGLLSYIRFLAREADVCRLREVCESFLGPPTGMAASSDPKNTGWDPYVLGIKKHKLLREDILPAMASNWKVQRLLNEFMDTISEYETFETKGT